MATPITEAQRARLRKLHANARHVLESTETLQHQLGDASRDIDACRGFADINFQETQDAITALAPIELRLRQLLWG